MRKYLIGISAAAILALAAGCGSDGDHTPGKNGGHSAASTQNGAGQAEHNDQDVAFAQMMIPHHQQAVDMAKMATEQATDPKVKDLATRIEGAQDPEIKQMTSMLKQWGEMTPSMPGMDHDMNGPGMMTADDMQHLEKATGTDFDHMWVQMMVQHHQGAVDMANTELKEGSNAEAKTLAKQIGEAQQTEITEMQTMSQ